jgi:hypothetical protein
MGKLVGGTVVKKDGSWWLQGTGLNGFPRERHWLCVGAAGYALALAAARNIRPSWGL